MKFPLRHLFSLAASVAFWGLAYPTGAAEPIVQDAGQVTILAERNRAYYLEGSTDGGSWQEVAGPWFGTGVEIRPMYSKKYFPPGLTQFQVRSVRAALVGVAPVQVPGLTLSIQESTAIARNYLFLSATKGVIKTGNANARSFQFLWTKAAGDKIILQTTLSDGSLDHLELTFYGAKVGLSKRTTTDAANKKYDPEGGPFSLTSSILWDVGPGGVGNSALPVNLWRDEFGVADGDSMVRYYFLGTGGTRTEPNGQTSNFSYTYNSTTPTTASLLLTGANWSDTLQLNLSNPRGGGFVRSPGTSNEEKGPFTCNPYLPTQYGGLPCEAPLNVVGKTYDFTCSSSPDTQLTFDDDSSGSAVALNGGAVEFTPFTYAYKKEKSTGAKIVLTFPAVDGDQVEEWELAYAEDCTGAFVRRIFSDGGLATSQTGTFEPGISLPGLLRSASFLLHP